MAAAAAFGTEDDGEDGAHHGDGDAYIHVACNPHAIDESIVKNVGDELDGLKRREHGGGCERKCGKVDEREGDEDDEAHHPLAALVRLKVSGRLLDSFGDAHRDADEQAPGGKRLAAARHFIAAAAAADVAQPIYHPSDTLPGPLAVDQLPTRRRSEEATRPQKSDP